MNTATNSFGKSQRRSDRWRFAWRLWYGLRAGWRRVRIDRRVTRWLGPQYRRSRNRIEIDITYACNLHCLNCNRSVSQAPATLHMPVEMVTKFVDESIARGKLWKRIRVLGGEPTLHPQFFEIIEELDRYRSAGARDCLIEVVTNGYGRAVEAKLARLPDHIWIDNSRKTTKVQPDFGPFNDAPVDDPRYEQADFGNGCAIMRDCGMGLTPFGYYPCAVAGGIERITGERSGYTFLPDDDDDMRPLAEKLCRLCGRFHDGHYVPKNLRPPLNQAVVSPSWERLYQAWRRDHRPERELPVGLTREGRPVGLDLNSSGPAAESE